MRRITIKLTMKETELLASLAADQVFRREFIDTKLPGYHHNPEEVGLAKTIIARLRASLKSGPFDNRHSARIAG